MKKLLFLSILFLMGISANAQRYDIITQDICWNTGSVDSSLTRYFLVSPLASTVKVLAHLNSAGQKVVPSGGTFSAGHCGCCGGASGSTGSGDGTLINANNGVSLNGDTVILGGTIKMNTVINGMGTYGLDLTNLKYLTLSAQDSINLITPDLISAAAKVGGVLRLNSATGRVDFTRYKFPFEVGVDNQYLAYDAVGDSLKWVSPYITAVETDSSYRFSTNGSSFSEVLKPREFMLSFDNNRLPLISKKIPAFGLGANEEVPGYEANDINAQMFYFSSTEEYGTGGEKGGWLSNGTSNDSVWVSSPFGVVIGDSQAEGHPGGHGRLHPGALSEFQAAFADASGVPSYHLREETGYRWFNHGIGGQTSEQVLARFDRDVLGVTSDIGDGRGAKTLQRAPSVVVVIVGINDFYTGLTVSDTKSNIEAIAAKCAANGIYCVILNIPGDTLNNPTQNAQIDSVNTWLSTGALTPYGTAIVDYNTWWKGGDASLSNIDKGSLIADDIHPSAVGYDSLAAYIMREAKLPKLDSIIIHTKIRESGFVGYSRPTSIRIDGTVTYSITDSIMSIPINQEMSWDSVSIAILASADITGTTYTGISHVEWSFSNKYAGDTLVTRREPNFPGKSADKWSGNGNIFPSSAGSVSIGSSTQISKAGSAINQVLTVKSKSNDNSDGMVFLNSDNEQILQLQNNKQVGVGINPIYNLHVQGSSMFQLAANNYSFFSGNISQRYGGTPTTNWQATNLGPLSVMNESWDGSTFRFSTATTLFPRYRWQGGLSTFMTYITDSTDVDLNGRLGLNTDNPLEQFDIDGNILLRGSSDGTTAGKVIFQERLNTTTGRISLRAQDTDINTEYSLPEGGAATDGMVLHNSNTDSLYWASPPGSDNQTASEVPITDTGNFFDDTDVEGALQTLADYDTVIYINNNDILTWGTILDRHKNIYVVSQMNSSSTSDNDLVFPTPTTATLGNVITIFSRDLDNGFDDNSDTAISSSGTIRKGNTTVSGYICAGGEVVEMQAIDIDGAATIEWQLSPKWDGWTSTSVISTASPTIHLERKNKYIFDAATQGLTTNTLEVSDLEPGDEVLILILGADGGNDCTLDLSSGDIIYDNLSGDATEVFTNSRLSLRGVWTGTDLQLW